MTVETMALLFTAMLFCHCLYDFHIQGILAQMKQKDWWYDQFAKVSQKQPEREVSEIVRTYGNDFGVALFIHGFEWAVFVTIPLFTYAWLHGLAYTIILLMIPVNAVLHAVIDDMKCNKMELNLAQDQLCHMCQIVLSFILFVWVVG